MVTRGGLAPDAIGVDTWGQPLTDPQIQISGQIQIHKWKYKHNSNTNTNTITITIHRDHGDQRGFGSGCDGSGHLGIPLISLVNSLETFFQLF